MKNEPEIDHNALVQAALNFTSEFMYGMTQHKITEAFICHLLEKNGLVKVISLDETNLESLKFYFDREVQVGETVSLLTYEAKLLAYNYEVAKENYKQSLN